MLITLKGGAVVLTRTERRVKRSFAIRPDVLRAVERLAKARGVSVSRAVEYLVEKGVPEAEREAR